jgi:hypothetical protein
MDFCSLQPESRPLLLLTKPLRTRPFAPLLTHPDLHVQSAPPHLHSLSSVIYRTTAIFRALLQQELSWCHIQDFNSWRARSKGQEGASCHSLTRQDKPPISSLALLLGRLAMGRLETKFEEPVSSNGFI